MKYLTELLDRHGDNFETKMPLKGIGEIELRWFSAHLSSGTATFFADGEPLSTNVMVSGIRPEADSEALAAAHSTLLKFCKAAGERASDALLRIEERPALASVRWSARDRREMEAVLDIEICLAAAFLERAYETGKLAF